MQHTPVRLPQPMNLQIHLVSRITLVALLCLMASTSYVLWLNGQQAREQVLKTSDSLVRQLELQLWRKAAGFNQSSQFPDFELWKLTSSVPGMCVHFAGSDGLARGLCTGASQVLSEYPTAFELLYRRLFAPGGAITRAIIYQGQRYGDLSITSSAEMEMMAAWNNIRQLLGLATLTVVAVCLLVYLSINRALRPAGIIVAGLERLQQGDLDARLPMFELQEWQRTALAINQLAASQQQLCLERQKLTRQLLALLEEERRYLARELHDEFGQCLTAINAIAASIAQTARQLSPELLDEVEQISHITQQMLASVRELLIRLRPAELDELGLAASLSSLVRRWNSHRGGKTQYQLTIEGDCGRLPEPLVVNLFRITQECLTNIAKHSAATRASLILVVDEHSVNLEVTDDGIATQLPFVQNAGIGLLGMRERVAALQGQLALSIVETHGLRLQFSLPLALSEV